MQVFEAYHHYDPNRSLEPESTCKIDMAGVLVKLVYYPTLGPTPRTISRLYGYQASSLSIISLAVTLISCRDGDYVNVTISR